jgi:hypothetical protein
VHDADTYACAAAAAAIMGQDEHFVICARANFPALNEVIVLGACMLTGSLLLLLLQAKTWTRTSWCALHARI